MRPLDGIRILDLTENLPGPYATQLLADLGAEVLKVEGRGGDVTRQLPPFVRGVGAFYAAINSGKASLRLDLKSPAGRGLLLRLAARSDALIEGFRPGKLAALGLGAAVLHEANPRLVITSLSGYGEGGPRSGEPSHDANAMALSGALGLTVGEDGAPVLPALQQADLAAGMQAALATVAGLLAAQRSGRGCVVATSIYEAALSMVGVYHSLEMAGEELQPGRMLLSGALPCYTLARARCGGFLAICPLEPKFWARFCELVERPQWRERAFDAGLRGELCALIATRDAAAWMAVLGAEVCVAPVRSCEAARGEAQFQALGMLSGSGERILGPWRFDGERPAASERLATSAGADRDEALGRWLGLSQQEIDGLAEAGAF